MLIVEMTAQANGAHRNQRGEFVDIPEGWASVPAELEAEARGYLPFIRLDVVDGKITGVGQGPVPPPEPAADPGPSAFEQARADIDYLAAMYGVAL